VVGCRSMVFGSGLLLYCVRAFESYLDICLFKEVGDFIDFGAVIHEGGPFMVFVVGFVRVGFMLSMSYDAQKLKYKIKHQYITSGLYCFFHQPFQLHP